MNIIPVSVLFFSGRNTGIESGRKQQYSKIDSWTPKRESFWVHSQYDFLCCLHLLPDFPASRIEGHTTKRGKEEIFFTL